MSTTEKDRTDIPEASARESAVVDAVPKQLPVRGQWRDAAGGAVLEVRGPSSRHVLCEGEVRSPPDGLWARVRRAVEVREPSTGQVLCEVADASPADGMAALDAAVAAQADFAAMSPQERSDILTRAFQLLHERIDDLAMLMTLEMGKPLAEAKGEIAYAAEFFRHFAGEATRINGGYQTAPA